MDKNDKVMEIYNKLKVSLENAGLTINNDNGVSDMIILAMYETYYNGLEKGELNGKMLAIEEIESKINKIKDTFHRA